MKKHFEQAIAFDRDSPLNQRTGLGKKYNELVDEYNALEAKILGGEAQEIADVDDEDPVDEYNALEVKILGDEDPVDDEQENIPADVADEDPVDVTPTENQTRNRG